MIYLRLFYEFFKAGLFSIGGGLASLPFLYEISDKTGWFTHAELANMIAISESTPGPIGINMAVYVGYSTGGILGAIVAALGEVAPSIIIILIIASMLDRFKDNKYVQAAFYGLRPASAGLIAAAGFVVLKITLLNLSAFGETGRLIDLFRPEAIILAAVLFVLTNFLKTKKLHPLVFILCSAVVGVVFKLT